MADHAKLAELFEASLTTPLAARPAPGQLEQLLTELVAAARARWPELRLGAELFVGDLARAVRGGPDPVAQLGALCAADLYLASACARNDSKAIALFEATYFPDLEAALREEGAADHLIDEVKQVLRDRFFVPRQDQPPSIAGYGGRGSLHAWVRVSGLREVYRASQANQRLLSLEAGDLQEAAGGSDPELGFLKRQYRPEFKRAFAAALATLSPRQRNLLRHSYLDRMSIDEIGQLYQVHRATAARWLEAARRALLEGTRGQLMSRLKLDPAECDSLLRLIESQLEVSLRSIDLTGA